MFMARIVLSISLSYRTFSFPFVNLYYMKLSVFRIARIGWWFKTQDLGVLTVELTSARIS